MSESTPQSVGLAPWSVRGLKNYAEQGWPEDRWEVEDANGDRIAGPYDDEALARKLAVAPDLLEGLEFVLAFAEAMSHDGEFPHDGVVGDCPLDPCRRFAAARAAIAKAKPEGDVAPLRCAGCHVELTARPRHRYRGSGRWLCDDCLSDEFAAEDQAGEHA